MKARMRLDGETPRRCAASSTRSISASGIRRLTIWRIVSGAGSAIGGSTTSMPSKPMPSCSTSDRRGAAVRLCASRADRNTRVLRRSARVGAIGTADRRTHARRRTTARARLRPRSGAGRRGTRRCRRPRRAASGWHARRAGATSPAARPTSSSTRLQVAGSRTTPPRGTSSRPASNCGFTSATTRAVGGEQARGRRGGPARRQMKLRSRVARSIGSGSDVSVRRFVRSMLTTRGSRPSRSRSCARPTSTA